MEIRTSYITRGNPEVSDETLADDIHQALSIPLETHISQIVGLVKDTINGRVGDSLHVRCFRTDILKQGWCFKSGSRIAQMPDILLGFTGDVADFTVTLIHELLHLFRWDEKILDNKAREIYYRALGGSDGQTGEEGGKRI